MTEHELLTEARRAVRHYFGRRRAILGVLERAGYPMEHFVWPAYERASTAPAGYEYRAATFGVADEVREVVGRTVGRKFAFSIQSGGYGGDDAPGCPLVEVAAREGRPTPLRLWCEAWPVRKRGGWPWRVRVMLYLVAVEGWPYRAVGAVFGVSELRVTQLLAPYLNPDAPPPPRLVYLTGGWQPVGVCRACGVRQVERARAYAGRCKTCRLAKRGAAPAGVRNCPACGRPAVPAKLGAPGRPKVFCSKRCRDRVGKWVQRMNQKKGA